MIKCNRCAQRKCKVRLDTPKQVKRAETCHRFRPIRPMKMPMMLIAMENGADGVAQALDIHKLYIIEKKKYPGFRLGVRR